MHTQARVLHQSPWQGVLHITGGGASLLTDMLSTPGASATVLEAKVPYAGAALADLLGREPEQAASATTARAMAMAAYARARDLSSGQIFGLGVTASLVTDRPKKGQTRAHWAIQTRDRSHTFALTLDASANRTQQENTLNLALWQSLGEVLLQSDTPAAATEHQFIQASADWQPLLEKSPYRWCSGDHDGSLLLPGSFDPIHAGHQQIIETAEELTGRPGAFELTLRNADKPDLDFLTVSERLEKISARPVWLTNLTSFADKAHAFPGAMFAVGTDTVSRIGELRFYRQSEALREQALNDLAACEVSFLVFGRVAKGRFIGLEDLTLPATLSGLCQSVPESRYRNDTSSSDIRRQNLMD